MINREDWWSTPIWNFIIPSEDINYTGIEQECYAKKEKDLGRVISNNGGWQSNDIFINKTTPHISRLLSSIEKYTTIALNEYGKRSDVKVALNNAWININGTGDSNNIHWHPRCVVSGVFYVKAPQDSGKITFYNDSRTDCYNHLYFDANNKNTFSSISYKAEVGRVLAFPPWLIHSVESSRSNEDRISIAFNFVGK